MRTKKTAINMAVNIGGQLLVFILGMLNRLVMSRLMPSDYLGVNGLFTNVLTIMSLAELGIGSAMLYVLYKPVAENDHGKIQELMNLYRVLYRYVALAVAAIGALMFPLLPVLVKSNTVIENLPLIYCMYVVQSISSYFFIYKSTLLSANQDHWIINAVNSAFLVARYALQAVVLYLTKNFLVYLAVQIVMGIIPNIVISAMVDKQYPFIRENPRALPPKEERVSIFRNVQAMFMHKLGQVMIYNVDNLLMSALIGLPAVGIYSNYKLIVTNVAAVLGQIIGAPRNSIGNMIAAVKDDAHIYNIFKTLNFACFLLFSYGTVAMAVLFQPFIGVFFGDNYLFPISTVLLILMQFYLAGMRNVVQLFRDAMGIFWHDRYKALCEVAVNLGLSLLLARYYGLDGILAATVIDWFLIPSWVEPYILFKHGIKGHIRHYLLDYYAQFALWAATMVVGGLLAWAAVRVIPVHNLFSVVLQGIVCTVVYGLFMLLCYGWTKPFRTLLSYVMRLVKKKTA